MDPCYAVYRFTVQLTELQLHFRSTILHLRPWHVRGEHLSSITGFRTSFLLFVQLCLASSHRTNCFRLKYVLYSSCPSISFYPALSAVSQKDLFHLYLCLNRTQGILHSILCSRLLLRLRGAYESLTDAGLRSIRLQTSSTLTSTRVNEGSIPMSDFSEETRRD